LSIVLTPAFFMALDRARPRYTGREEAPAAAPSKETPAAREPAAVRELPATDLKEHVVVVGFGAVGGLLGEGLRGRGEPFLVIEERRELVDRLRQQNIEVIHGHAPAADVMKAANLAGARRLFIAIPDGFEAGQIAEQARSAYPDLQIVARAHSDAEAEHLRKYGADVIVMGERELASAMLAQAFAKREPVEEPASRAARGEDGDAAKAKISAGTSNNSR
jgi:CPA2 family monovalent cation:H+ antiporter-2